MHFNHTRARRAKTFACTCCMEPRVNALVDQIASDAWICHLSRLGLMHFLLFNWKCYKFLKTLGGSEGAAVFKVTRQKFVIVLKNALKENFLVYLHLICSVL